MKIKKTLLAAALSAGLFSITGAHAALQQTLGGQGVYDTDLNVTWLQNANLAATNTFGVSGIVDTTTTQYASGYMSWNTAHNWIAAMNAANYLGYSDWRLPTTIDRVHINSNSYWDGQGYIGWNVTSSDLGHLYYNELGNLAPVDTINGSARLGGWGLTNTGPFSNIQPHDYWFGTERTLAGETNYAYSFVMQDGRQNIDGKDVTLYAWAVRDGNTLGGSVLDPIMPGFGGGFTFGVGAGQSVFIDPVVAVGYDYTLNSGPNIQSVLLPNIGDGLFDLFLWDSARGDYVFSQQLTQGISYDFGAGGVNRFRIMGIETSAGLDPNNPNAFVTGLTFAGKGIVDMNMTPHTFDTDVKSPVPEPETYAMLLAGLGLLGFTAKRRKSRTA